MRDSRSVWGGSGAVDEREEEPRCLICSTTSSLALSISSPRVPPPDLPLPPTVFAFSASLSTGNPNSILLFLNLSLTVFVRITSHLNRHPSTPNSLIRAVLFPNKYSSSPPHLSIVLSTLACTLTWTNRRSASLQSRLLWMLGRQTRGVFTSCFSAKLWPIGIGAPRFRPAWVCFFCWAGGYGLGGGYLVYLG